MSTNREGFSMVEVIVAMVLLLVILTMLAPASFQAARVSVTATDVNALQAASDELVNRFNTLPFTALTANAGCDSVGGTNARYRRCVQVTSASERATINITTTALQRRPDSVRVRLVRTGPPTTNALCTNGC